MWMSLCHPLPSPCRQGRGGVWSGRSLDSGCKAGSPRGMTFKEREVGRCGWGGLVCDDFEDEAAVGVRREFVALAAFDVQVVYLRCGIYV